MPKGNEKSEPVIVPKKRSNVRGGKHWQIMNFWRRERQSCTDMKKVS
jgi:hypothetical protein